MVGSLNVVAIHKGKKKVRRAAKTSKVPSLMKKMKHGAQSNVQADVFRWVILIACVTGWAVVLGSQFTKYQETTDETSRQLESLFDGCSYTSVLGITDTDISGKTATNTDEVVSQGSGSDASVVALVDEIEEDRKDTLRQKLLLQLPLETDNPSYPVTFVEPTETDVEIQVDGGGFSQKKSPFSLPSLSIGKHLINFRFEDENGISQNLEETIIVIPRAPEWAETQAAEFRSDESVVFSGTALPRSTIMLVVSSPILTDQTISDDEGNWEIMLRGDLASGEHSAVTFVRKEGYASNMSEPLLFTVGYVEGAASDSTSDFTVGDSVSSGSAWWERYVTEDNYYFVIGGLGVALITLIIIMSLLSKAMSRKDPEGGWVERKASGDSEGGSPSGISLREKFAKAGLKVRDVQENGSPGEGTTENTTEEGPDISSEKAAEVSKKKNPKRKNAKDEGQDDLRKTSDTKLPKDGALKEEVPNDEVPKEETPKDETSKTDGIPDDPGNSEDGTSLKGKKVYSKKEFMEKFGKETNKIRISLTSPR